MNKLILAAVLATTVTTPSFAKSCFLMGGTNLAICRCNNEGYQQGTQEFNYCVSTKLEQFERQRQTAAIVLGAMAVGLAAAAAAQPPPPTVTHCNTNAYGSYQNRNYTTTCTTR